MSNHSNEIGQLHHAALQLAVGFERTAAMAEPSEQAEALKEADLALSEMRGCCNQLIRAIRGPQLTGSSNFPQPVDLALTIVKYRDSGMSRHTYNPTELQAMSYHTLQALVNERFGNAPVPRQTEKRQEHLKARSLEDLVILVEYARRNMRWGHSDYEVVTYEDAMKHIYIPELFRRLEQFFGFVEDDGGGTHGREGSSNAPA